MAGFILSLLACGMEWLSIWAGVSRLKAKKAYKVPWLFHRLLCTMGLPSIIGVLFAVVAWVLNWHIALTLGVYVALNLLGLFIGAPIHNALFKGDANIKNPIHQHGSKKKTKKKKKR